MATAKKTHGGKRKGAGRPPETGDKRQSKISVTLTAEQKAWLKARTLGASAVIRALIDAAMEQERL